MSSSAKNAGALRTVVGPHSVTTIRSPLFTRTVR